MMEISFNVFWEITFLANNKTLWCFLYEFFCVSTKTVIQCAENLMKKNKGRSSEMVKSNRNHKIQQI